MCFLLSVLNTEHIHIDADHLALLKWLSESASPSKYSQTLLFHFSAVIFSQNMSYFKRVRHPCVLTSLCICVCVCLSVPVSVCVCTYVMYVCCGCDRSEITVTPPDSSGVTNLLLAWLLTPALSCEANSTWLSPIMHLSHWRERERRWKHAPLTHTYAHTWHGGARPKLNWLYPALSSIFISNKAPAPSCLGD